MSVNSLYNELLFRARGWNVFFSFGARNKEVRVQMVAVQALKEVASFQEHPGTVDPERLKLFNELLESDKMARYIAPTIEENLLKLYLNTLERYEEIKAAKHALKYFIESIEQVERAGPRIILISSYLEKSNCEILAQEIIQLLDSHKEELLISSSINHAALKTLADFLEKKGKVSQKVIDDLHDALSSYGYYLPKDWKIWVDEIGSDSLLDELYDDKPIEGTIHINWGPGLEDFRKEMEEEIDHYPLLKKALILTTRKTPLSIEKALKEKPAFYTPCTHTISIDPDTFKEKQMRLYAFTFEVGNSLQRDTIIKIFINIEKSTMDQYIYLADNYVELNTSRFAIPTTGIHKSCPDEKRWWLNGHQKGSTVSLKTPFHSDLPKEQWKKFHGKN